MAARPKREKQAASVREILSRHDVDPLDRLIREGVTEIKISATQAAMPCVQNLLAHYELVPGEGDGWILRPNLARRIEIWKATCDFVHPRLRSTDVQVNQDREIKVFIRTFKDGEEKLIEQEQYRQKLRTGPLESEPRQLHDGETANQS